ncbi:MAG: ribonuclease Z [Pseudonocardia sp.]|uniref:ribonuclease Z n=1 Tax=unclassified Pseudonocardia TaxID=2619320 RepID=UPI00086939D8|nr:MULTISPECIES: ribonuclease Z [unclassified Pseudonocardia]MBN9113126.1 ribonuclease Z [Pseudonocardia sp.]ODU07808.1 MAG: ribonuclease Z [Pseudonocardia sp. SCN 72-51]ODV00253.1 MAG: ribonuclease Z [Pseudonocardia sp. SCN 73-27]
MPARELVVLGTASQAPTRHRNHNGYLLRWDREGLLFDPGEGTQRQLLFAGVASSAITRICLTHFHGDHCLGVPGVVQRLSLDKVAHPVVAHYPESGAHFFERLRHATAFHEVAEIHEQPVADDGPVATEAFGTLSARRLDHPVESFGYRLDEPDGRRMLPDRLAAAGVTGPAVSRLARDGSIDVDGRTVRLDDVSAPRPGQSFAFVMDTRLCAGVEELAAGVDMLVIESTFLHADADLAHSFGHLTAREAGQVAARAGVGTLVLTHFSQRYRDPEAFAVEAAEVFDGPAVVAADLMRIPVPPRRTPPPSST